MIPEPYHAWIAIAATIVVFVGMQLRRSTPADLLFLFALVVVTISGVIDSQTALAGFANPAVITIAALLAVSQGLRHTGCLDWLGEKLLGGSRTEQSAMRRLTAVLISASAFLLNTALVAMMVPVVVDWCRKNNISPSRLLIPVSYLAILGGVCTLIGTSTTLVVNGMLKSEYQRRSDAAEQTRAADVATAQTEFTEQLRPMRLFELGYVGLPCAGAGVVVLLLLGRRLLPNRTDMIEQLGEQRREYLVEMLVQPTCRLIGQTVEAAGLRHLPGLFLIEIDRDGEIVTPVTPDDKIHAGDRLVFTGVVSTILDLQKIPGLVPAADHTFEFHPKAQANRHLTEAVLSRTSPVIGRTVRNARFRQRYHAAIVAVHRNGVRLTNKIGDIELEPGDTLLLQTRRSFVSNHRNNRDFYLVSAVEGDLPRRHDRALLCGFLMLGLIVWLCLTSWLAQGEMWSGISSPAVAALAVAVAMILTRCLPIAEARAAIDLQVVVVIAAALGLGRALTDSGAAGGIAESLVHLVGEHPYLLLIVVYLLAMIFTEMITNVAVAAMLFPLAVAVAEAGGFNPRPFVMAIALAASLSFITPIGYQTNLMVMGPGGYRPRDYLRLGLPVACCVATTALLLLPVVWPF
jgi:di/tricarboxylate transporter